MPGPLCAEKMGAVVTIEIHYHAFILPLLSECLSKHTTYHVTFFSTYTVLATLTVTLLLQGLIVSPTGSRIIGKNSHITVITLKFPAGLSQFYQLPDTLRRPLVCWQKTNSSGIHRRNEV